MNKSAVVTSADLFNSYLKSLRLRLFQGITATTAYPSAETSTILWIFAVHRALVKAISIHALHLSQHPIRLFLVHNTI